MGRWTPKNNDPVGNNEHIARRLYDEPKLFGASDQASLEGLQLGNFEPTSDNELSLDRVGNGCFDKKVARYLLGRAIDAGARGHEAKTFHGWLSVTARNLRAPTTGVVWDVVPSPDQGREQDGELPPWSDENLLQNLYHAHVAVPCASEKPTLIERYNFALQVREVLVKGQKHLSPHTPSNSAKHEPEESGWRGLVMKALHWAISRVRRQS